MLSMLDQLKAAQPKGRSMVRKVESGKPAGPKIIPGSSTDQVLAFLRNHPEDWFENIDLRQKLGLTSNQVCAATNYLLLHKFIRTQLIGGNASRRRYRLA